MRAFTREEDLRTFLGARYQKDLSDLPLDAQLADRLALDSLDGLELRAEIEDSFNVYFSDDQINATLTLRNLLEAIETAELRAAS